MQPPDVAKALQDLAAALLGGGGGGGGKGRHGGANAATAEAAAPASAGAGSTGIRARSEGKNRRPRTWRDGDWECGFCWEHNFGSRRSSTCFKCGQDSGRGGGGKSSGGKGGKGGRGGDGGTVGGKGGKQQQQQQQLQQQHPSGGPRGVGGSTPLLSWPGVRGQAVADPRPQPAAPLLTTAPANGGRGPASGSGGGGGGAAVGGKANRGKRLEAAGDGFQTVVPKGGAPAAAAATATVAATAAAAPARRWSPPTTSSSSSSTAIATAASSACDEARPNGAAAGHAPVPACARAEAGPAFQGGPLVVDIGGGEEGDYAGDGEGDPSDVAEPTHQELREHWVEMERQEALLRSAGLPRDSPAFLAAVEATARAKSRWQAARPAKPLPLRLRNQRKLLAKAERNKAWWADEVARIEDEYARSLGDARARLHEAQEKEANAREQMRLLRIEDNEGEDGDDLGADARAAAEAMGEAEALNRVLAPQLVELAAMAEHHDDGHPQRLLINSVLSGFKGITSVFERARGARLQWADASMEDDDDFDSDDDAAADDSTNTRRVKPRPSGTQPRDDTGATGAAAAACAPRTPNQPSDDVSMGTTGAAAAGGDAAAQQLQLEQRQQQEEAQRQALAQAQAAHAAAAREATRTQAMAARAEAEASFPSELKAQLAEVVNTAQGVGVDFFEDLVVSGLTVHSISAAMLREYVKNKGWQ